MPKDDIRVHEVTFCSRVSKWADALFQSHPDMPFRRTEIEESKGTKRKRSDLRVYVADDKLVLAGEVKLPGTPEGRNAYNSALVEDSYQKASNAGAEFFFTWNVNKLVLFDSKQWQKPIMERRLKDYDLGLDLDKPEDVSRAATPSPSPSRCRPRRTCSRFALNSGPASNSAAAAICTAISGQRRRVAT